LHLGEVYITILSAIHSAKSDIQKHSNNSRQRRHLNGSRSRCAEDTAGMVAGMVASGVTAKGLNGIEAEANKLAKAPKGIDGVTEGTGNVAEDVGKVVEW